MQRVRQFYDSQFSCIISPYMLLSENVHLAIYDIILKCVKWKAIWCVGDRSQFLSRTSGKYHSHAGLTNAQETSICRQLDLLSMFDWCDLPLLAKLIYPWAYNSCNKTTKRPYDKKEYNRSLSTLNWSISHSWSHFQPTGFRGTESDGEQCCTDILSHPILQKTAWSRAGLH